MSAKPATVKDQYGSRHNQDSVKVHQKEMERLRGERKRVGADLSLRESGQDLQPNRGLKNKEITMDRRSFFRVASAIGALLGKGSDKATCG